jgi:serine/threonine protein phosphatase PrpC
MQKHQTIPKIDEGFAPTNQDAVLAAAGYCALSDGAGGSGFVNEHWSRCLCDALPDVAFTDVAAFEIWYEKVRLEFFEEHLLRIDGAKNARYRRHGSYATLVAAWQTGEQLQVLSYGDSGLFLFDKTGELKYRNINNLMDFTESPYLLNTVSPIIPQALLLENLSIASGDMLVLASDAVSQWILTQYLLRKAKTDNDVANNVENTANNEAQAEIAAVLASPYNLGNLVENCEKSLSTDSFLNILQKMEACLATETAFKACCYDKYNRAEMANDDYTLLMWRF